MIRSTVRAIVVCCVCLPLIINAVKYEVRKVAPHPEHDAHDVADDIGGSAKGSDSGAHASGRSATATEFEITDYDLRGIDLARKQIARGLEKRKEKRRNRDQSFEGLRDVICDSSDAEIRRYLPVVNRLERAMDNRDRNDDANYVDGFITDFAPLALYLEDETGLPASVMLAQIIVESGWGASNITILKNNVLGIGNCDEAGEFVADVDFSQVERDIRVQCMADTTAFRFESIGESILYYTYLLLENEKNEKHYGALRRYIRNNVELADENPSAYRNRVIELIARGYHADPEWYEDYLRRVVRIVDETGILPRVESKMTVIASAKMAP